jgi:SHS2 domain-containing protein
MYRWLEHTSEVELSIEAPSEQAVFEEATCALAELLSEAPSGEPAEHEVSVSAADRPMLLATWLDELVYLSETEDFIPERVRRMEVADASAKGLVSGRRSVPQSLIKGVTYHRLEMQETDGAWQARVVLDV